MSQELEIYGRITDPLAAVQQLGAAIAKSKMFGCDNEAQGQVLALECMARRLPPLSLAERYHIVEGKLMMRYDAMLAEFTNLGGTYKVLERTAEAAEIELTLSGQTIRERFTWDDAQKEPLPFGKDGKIKKNWATPRSRRQMLWARTVSEGIRTICPRVNYGRVTPEEIDRDDDAIAGTVNGHAVPPLTAEQAMAAASGKKKGKAEGKPAAAPTSPNQEPVAGEVIDAEYTVIPPTNPTPSATTPELCTAQQRDRINQYWGALEATDEQRTGMLAKRNVTRLRDLTVPQAAELIDKLAQAAASVGASLAGESTNATATHAVKNNDPCLPDQVEAIKAILTQRGQPELIQQVKAHLNTQGIAKIADLTISEADALKHSLEVKNLELFFAQVLRKN